MHLDLMATLLKSPLMLCLATGFLSGYTGSDT
jgi:hypothetical protein